jgi:hypothetical protein
MIVLEFPSVVLRLIADPDPENETLDPACDLALNVNAAPVNAPTVSPVMEIEEAAGACQDGAEPVPLLVNTVPEEPVFILLCTSLPVSVAIEIAEYVAAINLL